MYKQRFIEIYGHLPQAVYAAPGRVELCGNHTDHQGGRVLAAAIDRAVRIYARKTGGSRVTVHSEGFEPCVYVEKPCEFLSRPNKKLVFVGSNLYYDILQPTIRKKEKEMRKRHA